MHDESLPDTEVLVPDALAVPTVPAAAFRAAARWRDREALVDGETRMTFGQMESAWLDVTRAALASGIRPGDRVSIWAPNGWRWVVAALGVLGAGGVLVPLNTRFRGREASYVLGRSRARVLFTVTDFLGSSLADLLQDHRDELTDLEEIVSLDDRPVGDVVAWDDFLERSAGVDVERARRAALAVAPEALSDIMFTSGTTGWPKGVLTSHRQIVRVYEQWTEVVGLRAGDRYLVVNPFFHTFGYKAGWFSCVLRGASIYPMPVFDVGKVLEVVAREHITVLPGPPTLMQGLLDAPDRSRFDLSSLRLTMTGAASVPVSLVRRLDDELAFDVVLTGYGLTETCGTVSMSRAGDDAETVALWAGKALPGTEVAVVDDEGRETPRGEPGEVVVRGYNVMRGYLDDDAATSEAIDVDGWLHTGDIGIMDERGYLRITDRKKDMFIVGGFNAYPAEVENLLLDDPRLSQAAVVGVPDDRLGEVGMAFVIPRPGTAVDPADVIEFARGAMANYKVPRYVEVVEELPVNASGKVLKYELRERGLARLASPDAGAEDGGRGSDGS